MQVWWNDCTWLVGTPPGFWVWETPASSHPHPLPPFWRKISPPMSSWVLEAFSPHPHPFLSLRETPTPSPQSLCLSTLCICVFMFLCCSGFDKRACTFQKQFREFLKTRENILSLLRRSVTENPSGFYPCCVFCPCWEGQWLKALLDFILIVCSVPVEKFSQRFYMSTDVPVRQYTCSVYFFCFGITCTMTFQLIYCGTYPKINLTVYLHASLSSNHKDLPVTTTTCVHAHIYSH